MAFCEMCGTEMPSSAGRCALGHLLAVVEAAPSPPSQLPPSLPPPPAPQPAAETPDSPVVEAPPVPAAAAPPEPVVPAPSLPVSGSLAIEPSAVPEEHDAAAFAPPLVELVVAEERKRRFPKWFTFGLALAMAASGVTGWVVFGPGGASAEAAVYARISKAGESHTYTMSLAMRGSMEMGPIHQPLDVAMSVDLSEKVLSVAEDGTSSVRFDIIFASVEANGQRIPIPGTISISARVARDGRVLSSQGTEGLAAGGANPMSGFFGPESMQPTFPSDKVAPGDRWTTRMRHKIPFGDKPLTVTTRNKLLRLETEHGIPVAVLHSVMEMPMNFNFSGKDLMKMSTLQGGGTAPEGARMSFTGTITFDAIQTVVRDTGRPIAVTGEGVYDVVMKVSGAGAPQDAAIKMRMNIEASMAEILGGQAA